MGIFDWLSGRKNHDSDQEEQVKSYPWDRRPSIYEHIVAHIEPGTKGLSEGGETLPDEERLASESQLRWAPGALDGVLSHHMGGGGEEDKANELLAQVKAY